MYLEHVVPNIQREQVNTITFPDFKIGLQQELGQNFALFLSLYSLVVLLV